MTTALQLPQQGGLIYSHDRVDLIKRTICKGASDDELALFIEQCRRSGLDPFSGQIYSVRRKEYDNETKEYTERNVTMIGIEGRRLLAERSGRYAGQVGPLWCGKDGQWIDIWLNSEPPAAAKVGVIRTDFTEPIWGIAKYDSYCQKKGNGDPFSIWKKMPDAMLAKCAEALALRKAFPSETSGLLVAEDMELNQYTGEVISNTPQPAALPPPATKSEKVLTAPDVIRYYRDKLGVETQTLELYMHLPSEQWGPTECQILKTLYNKIRRNECGLEVFEAEKTPPGGE